MANAAKMNQADLDKKVNELERLAAKCETLAARENSRQNSTPEVRIINQKIEFALEEVHKQEGHASQTAMDCSALEHEKEKLVQDFEEQNEASLKKLSIVYSNIRTFREDISQTRFKNLTTFLSKQDKFARAEIDLQRVQTLVMAYTQLCAGIQFEFTALPDPDNGAANLNAELEKLEKAIQSIPTHQPISMEQQQSTKSQCDNQVNIIKELEQKIISSINEMSQAEDQQDGLTKQLHEEQTRNDELRTFLQQEEMLINESETQIKTMQEEDANKLDLAKLEIERLNEVTIKLEKSNQEKEAQIAKLKEGTATIANDAKVLKSPIDVLRNKIQTDSKDLSAEIDRLLAEEAKLKAENAQISLP
ncbi:hypothetical protein TRFO_12555 [Tritrichomonas foetus]|uniref:Uncharacterized protein n=1 Tax=Tritrichomonas foetus TaxID=1144522 RepID=A0A1J4L130_9EUKA|nr:hypothetical protein TRFO_12555 [Tritrichomonas foetus]|eukprot:OHT17225.1 hypothetical protein TRFO_12555 [Tritrichomonas foetus]